MMAALKKWYDRLDDILMCSVCLEIPKSKILQCISGHAFCPFCKSKLQLCPLCQSGFTTTRNIVAENIIDCIESMKVCIDNELKSMEAKLLNRFEEEQKKKCPDKKVKTVSSQTNYSMRSRDVSKSTQTDKVSFTNSMEKSKKKPPKEPAGFYPCLIGSCLLELPYMDLIKHLTMCHKGTFYQVEQSHGIFTDKCIIETDILPKRMDFTFLIKNMGLFFFNVTIHDDGLAATVKAADHMMTDRFEYLVAIGNKRRLLNGRNLVTSCRFNEKPAASSCVVKFGKEKLPMIGHESIECTLTIQRCKLRAHES